MPAAAVRRAGVNDSDGARFRALRRELGGGLKSSREAAGFSQAQLARRTGYARSTVSTVESGGQNVPRVFWERCDAVLGTGLRLATAYDQLAWRLAAIRRDTAASTGPAVTARQQIRGLTGTAAEAAAAYRALGWDAELAGAQVELACGTGVDALEVPRAAGVVAVRWWLHTGGLPDPVRCLPGLPAPADAMAVIATPGRFFFLVQPGACPWADSDLAPVPGPAATHGAGDEPAVRWHARGSKIVAPPSPGPDGHYVTWAHPPPSPVRLADPIVLLDLLARAVAIAGHQHRLLTMPGGVRVTPAPANPSAHGTR
jgi:transcriptional regulator with XRE-family HTH domain